MGGEKKMVNDDWLCKITDCDVDYQDLIMSMVDINKKLQKIDEYLDDSDFCAVGYEDKYSKIEDVHDKLKTLSDFVQRLPEKMDEVDSEYLKTIQNNSLYKLSQIKVEDFTTKKVGSLSLSYSDHENVESGQLTTLNFADFLGISGNEYDFEEDYAFSDGTINDNCIRSFAELFRQQYEEEVAAGNVDTIYEYLNGTMTDGEFVQKRQHSIYVEAFSAVVDFIPVAGQAKIFWELATGKEAFTGDEMTFSEMRNTALLATASVIATPSALSGFSAKHFEGAVVDLNPGIGTDTLKELNREGIRFTDDYTERIINEVLNNSNFAHRF